jgi:hypothetical protein
MIENYTSTERVLFNATFNFALKVEKLSEAEALEQAKNKIIKKRALGKTIKSRH